MTETATMGSHSASVEHHGSNYIAVFIYLTLLTGAELGIYALHIPRILMIGSLVALALAKAVLVAMYFMHLSTERKGLWVVAVTPLVIVAFCYFMLRPDLSARSYASHQENVVIGHPEGHEASDKAPSGAEAQSGSQAAEANPVSAPADSGSAAAASPAASQPAAPSGAAPAPAGDSKAAAPPQ